MGGTERAGAKVSQKCCARERSGRVSFPFSDYRSERSRDARAENREGDSSVRARAQSRLSRLSPLRLSISLNSKDEKRGVARARIAGKNNPARTRRLFFSPDSPYVLSTFNYLRIYYYRGDASRA